MVAGSNWADLSSAEHACNIGGAKAVRQVLCIVSGFPEQVAATSIAGES
tara:strand:- start:3526 stop:3672 length:147 start_codon:yes stop_codon:yes gene_type:complete